MHWLSRVGLVLGCAVCVLGSSPSESPPGWCDAHPLAQRLDGVWRGEGELFGRPATSRMVWSCTLNGRFLRLAFSNGFVGEAGAVIEAEAFYATPVGDSADGSWFDSRGTMLVLRAALGDSVLQTIWSGGGERGRTAYRISSDGGMLVTDAAETAGGWHEFGRASYRRE